MSHETPEGLFARAGEFLKRHARRPNADVRAYTYLDTMEMMAAFAAEVADSPPHQKTQRDAARSLVQTWMAEDATLPPAETTPQTTNYIDGEGPECQECHGTGLRLAASPPAAVKRNCDQHAEHLAADLCPACLFEQLRDAKAREQAPAADTGLIEELEKLRDEWRTQADKALGGYVPSALRYCADALQELLARLPGQPVGEG